MAIPRNPTTVASIKKKFDAYMANLKELVWGLSLNPLDVRELRSHMRLEFDRLEISVEVTGAHGGVVHEPGAAPKYPLTKLERERPISDLGLPRLRDELLELGELHQAYQKLKQEWEKLEPTGWYARDGMIRNHHIGARLAADEAKARMDAANHTVLQSAIEMYLTRLDVLSYEAQEEKEKAEEENRAAVARLELLTLEGMTVCLECVGHRHLKPYCHVCNGKGMIKLEAGERMRKAMEEFRALPTGTVVNPAVYERLEMYDALTGDKIDPKS